MVHGEIAQEEVDAIGGAEFAAEALPVVISGGAEAARARAEGEEADEGGAVVAVNVLGRRGRCGFGHDG